MNSEAQEVPSIPYFLEDYGKMLSHFQEEFQPSSSKKRGDLFAEFTRRLVPHTEIGQRFERPVLRQETYDQGVDLEAVSNDGSEALFVQAKYTIAGVDEIDLVLSKFASFLSSQHQETPQMEMFPETGTDVQQNHFMIVTTQDLSRIIPRYEGSHRRSVDFYRELKAEGRIHVIDGPQLLSILRETYKKTVVLPSQIRLPLSSPYIHINEVFISVIHTSALKELYSEFGEALFFENIREYLGPTSGKVKSGTKRITVNEEITKTIEDEPERFLARNNGVVFRARAVEPQDDGSLLLAEASIVNGRQTTMSIVKTAPNDCFVLVKVVEAPDTWDIAVASNFQNQIEHLDLELARYIRPQAVRAAAAQHGFRFQSEEESAYSVLDAIYQREVRYEAFKALFLGVFSSSPSNALRANYTQVNTEIIRKLFRDNGTDREMAFETLLQMHHVTQEGARKVAEALSDDPDLAYLFQRFWKDDKPQYRAIMTILAAAGLVNKDMYSAKGGPTYDEMMQFLRDILASIESDTSLFLRYFQLAFTSIAIDSIKDDQEREVMLQHMQTDIARSSFSNLFLKLRALASTDYWLKEYYKTRRA